MLEINKKFTLFLATIPFMGFIVGYTCGFFTFQAQTQEVPNLLGKNIHNAIESASAKKLSLRLLQEKEDDLLPEGTVIQQTPRPMHKVRLNQTIFITISKKPAPHTAPELVQKKQKDIAQQIATSGISTTIIKFQDKNSENTCVAQSPHPAETVSNQKMLLYISAGQPNLYIMPNFKDIQVQNLQQDLQTILQHPNITFDIYDSAGTLLSPDAAGTIVEQKPVAGSIVNLDNPLHIQLLLRTQ